MSLLITAIGALKGFVTKETCFDDLIDDIHHSLTSGLLLALAVLVSFKQFGGKPMECMVPLDWNGAWEQYAENYCFAENTYWLSFDNMVPQNYEDRKSKEIAYYQWVPFFLVFMGGCFKLPSYIWKVASTHSGIRVHKIISEAVDPKNVDAKVRQETIGFLTCHLANALKFHRRLERKDIQPFRVLKCLNLPYTAYYVTVMYLLTKMMYLVREMANLQMNTFQCVLTINLFNEKIFIFLWFWFMVLSILTILSMSYWAMVLLIPAFHRWFITRHLELSEMNFDPAESAKDVHRFVRSYMKSDGMFVLRMITAHTGIIFGTELTVSLWRSFYGVEEVVRQAQGKPPMTAPPILIPPPSFMPKRVPYTETLTAVPELFTLPQRLMTAPLRASLADDAGSKSESSDFYFSCKPSPDIAAIRQEKFLEGKDS